IRVAEHATFVRHGNDLHCTVSVPMTAAALGTTVTLALLEADLEAVDPETTTTHDLEIKPGTQSGTEQVLRGLGVPGLRGGRGDLIVTVVVETPTKLDARQEELLLELAALRGEEAPEGTVRSASKSVFGRLRNAFGANSSEDPMSLPVHLVDDLGSVGDGDVVEVTGDEAHHAVAVRRLAVGERVVLTDGAGTAVTGTVATTGKRIF